jgi:hypothetical protein
MVFNSILGFGDQTFTTIVLLLSAAITSHYVHGWGTRKGRDLFIVLVLLLILAVQYTHLIRAATYIPANRFYVWNVSSCKRKFNVYLYRSCAFLMRFPFPFISLIGLDR